MSCTRTAFGKLIQVAAKIFACAITVGLTSSNKAAISKSKELTLQGRYRVILISLLAIAWAFGSRASSQVTGPLEKQEQARVWVHENYKAVIDLISRDKTCDAAKDPRPVRWSVCVRVRPGHENELECVLWLEKRDDGTAYAQITRPRGKSIYLQLLKLKTDRPNASPTDLAKLVAVKSRGGDQQTFPGLVSLTDEFERIRLSPVLSDELMMDPTTYFIHAEALWGERMELILYGPGPSTPHQSDPMLEWVERLRRLLSESGGSKTGD